MLVLKSSYSRREYKISEREKGNIEGAFGYVPIEPRNIQHNYLDRLLEKFAFYFRLKEKSTVFGE